MRTPAVPPAIVPAYFDAALVAKFYLNEPGRDTVRRLARTSGVVMSSGITLTTVPTRSDGRGEAGAGRSCHARRSADFSAPGGG